MYLNNTISPVSAYDINLFSDITSSLQYKSKNSLSTSNFGRCITAFNAFPNSMIHSLVFDFVSAFICNFFLEPAYLIVRSNSALKSLNH